MGRVWRGAGPLRTQGAGRGGAVLGLRTRRPAPWVGALFSGTLRTSGSVAHSFGEKLHENYSQREERERFGSAVCLRGVGVSVKLLNKTWASAEAPMSTMTTVLALLS